MNQSTKLKVVGFDPSLRNWGIAEGAFCSETRTISIVRLSVVNPVLSTGKQVRQNSDDIEAGYQLYKGAIAATVGAHAVFVEVPIGSQSARAMASYGICVGVLGALRANGIPFFEVTPTEVKVCATGNKTATKRDMIQWAYDNHPDANWPFFKKNGTTQIVEGKAEHMADAIATIYAGIASNPFQQMLPFLAANK